MEDYKTVMEFLVKKLFLPGVISYKTDPRTPDQALGIVTGPPDPWNFIIKVQRFDVDIRFPKKYLGTKIKVPELISSLEYDLEQKLLRNIKANAVVELDEVVLKVEF